MADGANGVAGLRVAVVGGGITGLTAAYRLLRAGAGSVHLIEERPRLGGNVQTERHGGLILDGGPDSFVITRPQALALCKELGLEGRLVATTERNRKVYVAQGNGLVALPEGLMLGVPTRFSPMARSSLFSWRAKVRMGFDLFLPRGEAFADESIAAFIRRRLGHEALDRVAEPLLGGIYAGDVEALSMRSAFPQLVEMEQKYGSLIRGALAERRARAITTKPSSRAAPPSPFLSLLGGMGELIDALAGELATRGCHVRCGARVAAVAAGEHARFDVRVDHADGGRETLAVDHVVMAAPAYASASALAGLDSELATRLNLIPYLSTGTVLLAYARVDVPHALDAVGVVLPRAAGREILAATFISSKWTGRAPDDVALLRVFVGGHRHPGALARSDEELVELARAELGHLVGVRARPSLSRVFRFERSNPQPFVGHPARVMRLKQMVSRHPGLHIAGAAYDGVGIPDCIRQATEVAEQIVRQVSS